MMMTISGSTQLARTWFVALSDGKRGYSVLHDPDGTSWCYECAREQCPHTAAVANAIAAGTAPAPVRRKGSGGGRRAGAGRPKNLCGRPKIPSKPY